jgi:hypothetical protein
MSKNILLIEPDYHCKLPPLGLMKISTYHKKHGDTVTFFKGLSKQLKDQIWDRIYVSTLFTFYWEKTIKTIKYYSKSVNKTNDLYVGGIMASLMSEELRKQTKTSVVKGLLNLSSKIGYNDNECIDLLPLDYSIIDPHCNILLKYNYPVTDSYFLHATRGCLRACKFCSVNIIEPKFIQKIPFKTVIENENKSQQKRNLVLLDNNVLLSPQFNEIIDEIEALGFASGSKLNGKKRYVDFNQGLDIRLLTKKHLKKLSNIALRPLRFAFDHLSLQEIYKKKIVWAIDAGFNEIATYVLFNYKDSPEDLYERLKISSELNKKYGCRIYSFPMKYIPYESKDRKYLGEKWTRRMIRSLQCILNATHGIVPTSPYFFNLAFGNNLKEFLQILQMPENYIIQRSSSQRNGVLQKWQHLYESMSSDEKMMVTKTIVGGKGTFDFQSDNSNIEKFLEHYRQERYNGKTYKT